LCNFSPQAKVSTPESLPARAWTASSISEAPSSFLCLVAGE
jgi:hypothetical protein